MAFKAQKRLATQDEGGSGTSSATACSSSNVVATQSWVVNVLKRFWDWTRFFATEQLKVAGSINSGRVKTSELETNDLYAHRFILLDDDCRPAVITLKNGILDVDYDFRDVFLYPGDLSPLKYVYRFPDANIMRNFIGLTPYETYLNFIPFESNETDVLEDIECPRLCSADGKEVLAADRPILVKCPRTRRIVDLEVLDESGNHLDTISIPQIDGSPTRILTINMPCFRKIDNPEEKAMFVALPSSTAIDDYSHNNVMPPFLRPDCDCGCHPGRPIRPETLSPDLFDDDPIEEDDLFNDDVDCPSESWVDFNKDDVDQYEPSYEDYATNTYSNVTLMNNNFQQNVKQFLKINT